DTSELTSHLMQALDPELKPVIDVFPLLELSTEVLPLMRGALGAPAALSDAVERTEHLVGDVPVRVHRPVGVAGPLPCVVSIHGGGYVLGSYAMDDVTFDEWCPALGVVGVSVEYRLAPETPYPGPLEDCYSALKWAYDEAAALGIDRDRIGIRGISAGGGLAAGLGLLARDRGEVPVAFQLLDCPMIDDRMTTPSIGHDGLPVWSRESNTFGWQSYLGELYGTDDVPYTAAPARCEDLAGLPPTFVSVGTVDGFHDEDVTYALRLNQAGVPTELHTYPGASHAYHAATESRIARQSRRDQLEWLAHQVRR
ncbi:MAG: lipase, partial [Actinomycetia bacterium]|nr:lipase [Actinomycetes bacterium]